jgi:hypothetical protein
MLTIAQWMLFDDAKQTNSAFPVECRLLVTLSHWGGYFMGCSGGFSTTSVNDASPLGSNLFQGTASEAETLEICQTLPAGIGATPLHQVA